MSKINSLHINNFKFFGEADPIVLDGKNLLLYGENGSGKSSIYNALYTLLEAASKTSEGVQKYFLPLSQTNSESLLNIQAPQEAESFVEIIDDGGKHYRLSKKDTNICGDDSSIESQRVCDFINYRSLFSFQSFKNSESSNLHDVFEYAIVPYLQCKAYKYLGKSLKTFSDLFKAYYDIEVLKRDNGKGKKVIYKDKNPYKKHYIELEEHINKELLGLVEYINEQLPTILKQLKYSFNATLKYHNLWHVKHDDWLDFQPYSITLEIDEYRGKSLPAPITHPNVFLNEAKMSALAFAIRWAVFSKRPGVEVAPNALRFLVLDDLMISLDMCNRENLIKLLLGSTINNYQLLFMTHDRNLYNYVKEKINKELWITKEMYVGEEDGTNREYPVIIDGEDEPIEKARKYYAAKDYVTSGLYIRKALEKLFVHLLPQELYLRPDGSFVSLQTLWGKLREFYTHHGQDITPEIIELFKDSKLLVLNPDAHFQRLSTPVYRNELLTAFTLYEELSKLSKIESELVIPKGSIAEFDDPEVNYYCRFEFDKDLIIIEGDRLISVMPKCKNIYWRYNGIEYYDFKTGMQNLTNRLIISTPKLHKFVEGLTKISPLGITEEKFIKKCVVNGTTLDECMAGIKISSLILSSTCV